MRRAAVASMLFFFGSTAFALEPIPGEERFEELRRRYSDQESDVGGEMSFRQIGGEYYLQFNPRLDLNLGLFGIGLQIPINLRVYPTDSKDKMHPLREQDWDEPGEFLKFIRYFRIGNKRDFLYLRVGQLIASIGHGTIMHRYVNNTDLNTFRTGVQFDLNTNYGGLETMISDIAFFDPKYSGSRLFAARGYIKPVGLFEPESSLNIFQIGATVAVDENAPYQLATESSPTGTRAQVDDNGKFVIDINRPAVVFGFDAEAEVFNNWVFELIPYTDVNIFPEGDPGFHLGFKAALKLPFGIDFTIPLQVEYRHFGAKYTPAYFGSLYEQERLNYGQGQPGVTSHPKLRAVKDTANSGGLNGWYGEMAFDVGGYVQVGAIYEDFERSEGGTLGVFVAVPAVDWLQAKAYYARWSIKDAADIFALDSRSLLVAQLRMQIPYVPFLYAVARFTRRWEVDPDLAIVRSVDDWLFGVEANYDFDIL